MSEQIVARVDELPEGERKIITHGKMEIGVFNIKGSYYALPNVCAHQFGPLCEGRLTGTLVATEETSWQRRWEREGEILTCPWHALEFDVTSGHCLAYPRIRLRQYPVRIEGEHIIITL